MNGMGWGGALRRVVVGAFFAFAGLAMATGEANAADPSYRIKLAGIYPADSQEGLTTKLFADLVRKKTNGKINIAIFPNAQLGDEQALLQTALTPGWRDMSTLSITIFTTVEPKVGATILPFLFRDEKHVEAFMTSKAFEMQRDMLIKARGLRMLGAWDYMPSNFYTNKPVAQLADLKGLKLRVPPSPAYVKLVQALGANPTPIPLTELYMSLQTGVVDGTNGIDDLMISMKLSEVVKNVIDSHHQINFGNPTISEQFYQSMPPAYQKALTEAAVEAGAWNHKHIRDSMAELQASLIKAGMKIVKLQDFPEWQKAASPVYDDFTQKNGSELLTAIKQVQ